MYGLYDLVCDGWLTKVERTTGSLIQQSVHRGKCLSGTERLRKKRFGGRLP
jgi:hypothetical protein